jgi:hypothetical protein
MSYNSKVILSYVKGKKNMPEINQASLLLFEGFTFEKKQATILFF